MLHFQKITVLVVLSSMLYACGGGGGGSTSTKVISEYERQGGLGLINAAPAYMAYDAASTNTVTVAVIDTGVDLDHPEFAGRIAIGGYDFFADDDDANPDMQTFTPEPDKTDEENAKAEKKRNKFLSHGTFVAGIIAAAKKDVGIHGVAYNAKILPIRIGNSEGEISLSNIKKGVEKAVEQGAQVINASFGSAGFNRMLADAWLAAHEADIISVHAAGNNFTNTMTATVNKVNPIFGARIPVESGYEDLAKTLIAVVATDKDNEIAKYSNRCGDAKQWCMAAPGNKIFSTAVDGLYFR
ncbi:MAG: S8 family serine peptidase, partial [Candidatus Thioglobus sp.]